MTKAAALARCLLAAVLVASAGLTGCSSEGAARTSEPSSLTPAQAQQVLAQKGPSGEGRFPGGTFTFGSPFDNSDSPFSDSDKPFGGRLASASWDVYWYRNDGDRASWGVGIDILPTPERASRLLDDGPFWCPSTRRIVTDFEDGGLADVRTSSCRHAGGQGFYATLDAADGPVLTHVTVGGPTRTAAVAALRAVFPPIRDAVVRLRTALG